MLNDTKKTIVFLIGGIVLAVSSFLCYYLIEPRNLDNSFNFMYG